MPDKKPPTQYIKPQGISSKPIKPHSNKEGKYPCYKERWKEGEIYILEVHHYQPSKPNDESSTFYNVRALCIGDNTIGSVGQFVDRDGNVFWESCTSYLESEWRQGDKKLTHTFPISARIRQKISPPAKLQDINDIEELSKQANALRLQAGDCISHSHRLRERAKTLLSQADEIQTTIDEIAKLRCEDANED